jgi:hypothetical protein
MPSRRKNQQAAEPPLPYDNLDIGEEPLPGMAPNAFPGEDPMFADDLYGGEVPADVYDDFAAEPLPETGMGFDFTKLNVQTREDFDALPVEQQELLKAMKRGVQFTPEGAAQFVLKQQETRMQQEQRAAMMQADPVRQSAAATKQVELAEKQKTMQQAYLEEVQYQNNLNLVADPNTDRTTRRAALNAIDGLAATIGKRSMGGVASRDAMRDAKKSVGSISVMQEYNPFADYGPQIELMRRGSEERMGVLRQQMEAAGVTMPEAQQVEAAKSAPGPDAAEVALQRFGVKLPDGNPLMIDGSPVIQVTKGGQPMMLKRAANGKFVELADADRAKLPQ